MRERGTKRSFDPFAKMPVAEDLSHTVDRGDKAGRAERGAEFEPELTAKCR